MPSISRQTISSIRGVEASEHEGGQSGKLPEWRAPLLRHNRWVFCHPLRGINAVLAGEVESKDDCYVYWLNENAGEPRRLPVIICWGHPRPEEGFRPLPGELRQLREIGYEWVIAEVPLEYSEGEGTG